MTEITLSPSYRRDAKIIFAIVFLVEMSIAVCAHLSYGANAPSYEAVTRTGVGMDLLAGESRGRQGFIGSLYWTPLPTLLILPFLCWPFLARTSLAGSVVAAGALAGACAFLSAWWAECRVARWARMTGVILLCACPWTFWSVAGGESALLFIFLALVSMALVIRWLQKHTLRTLAYLAVVLALLFLTRFQSVALIVIIGLLILADLVFQNPQTGFKQKWFYAEATLIIFLAPLAYAALVWLAANWLIMGDVAFFLRGLFPSRWPSETAHGAMGWLELLRTGCEWPVALVAAILVGGVWLAGRVGDHTSRISPAATLLVLLTSTFICGLYVTKPYIPAQLKEDRELAEVLEYLQRHHYDDRVVIAGYRGYDLVRRAPEAMQEVFVHTLSFYLGKTLRDTRGKRLFLLIHRPTGSDRWENIQLLYPDIFERGVEFTVFEKGWNDWQLLEVVRTDE